jgi:nuclear pore complex protein Nup160
LGEIFEEPNLAGPARVRAFYDRCDFSNQIGDEEYNQLVASLGGGFTNLTEAVYEQIIGLLDGSNTNAQKQKSAPFADYGGKVILRGVQETVELQRNISLDQLIVLVLIEAEINHGEEGIAIESSLFFLQLLEHLRRLELIDWLATTQISLPLQKLERSNSTADRSMTEVKKTAPKTETVSVLEGVFKHLFGANIRNQGTLSAAITEVIVQICSPNSREYETAPSSILGWLLFHDRVDLALQFVRFGGRDPFSTYMQGRVFLAASDSSIAASHFKKAAFGMCKFLSFL